MNLPPTAPPPGYSPLGYNLNYGPNSQKIVCPFCSADVKTTTQLKSKSSTHMWACLLSLCLCCCCPYCCNSCNNVNHSCPNCKRFLGTYNS